VNETNRAEVYADLIAWMDRQVRETKAKPGAKSATNSNGHHAGTDGGA
jgi:hypothetical protein